MLQKAEKYRGLLSASEQLAVQKCFFHWELEFPEVFYGIRPGTQRTVDRFADAGFDAVVGNPPYVNAIELNRILSRFEKPYWAHVFESARGAYDIYVLFLEKALRLLRPANSRAGLITPNKYLAAPYGEALRTLLLDAATLLRVLDVSHVPVFADPSVYPVVLIYARCLQKEATALAIDRPDELGKLVNTAHDYRMLRLLPEFIWGFLLSEGVDIVEKLLRRAQPLSAVCEINASTTAAEADEFGDLISEEKPSRSSGWKIVNTGTIDPYRFLWGAIKLTHAGARYLRPYLHYDERRVSEKRRSQYNSPKLVFAKMANRIEVAYDHDGQYASVNTNFAFTDGEAGFFYLGVLNSRL